MGGNRKVQQSEIRYETETLFTLLGQSGTSLGLLNVGLDHNYPGNYVVLTFAGAEGDVGYLYMGNG